jgi:hypothetical protein
MKTARRLDIIEEYFSSKLREATIGFRRKPIINMGIEAQTCGHHNCYVKLALEDENAHQYQS